MGFQFSTVFDIMWNHPVICASVLLLLTPSLFHILLYFSPLLISTALFIVALVSMGPRMQETKEEREKWAKGERPVDLAEDGFPYPEWMSTSTSETAPVKKRRSEDAAPGWLEVIEEGRSKLVVWIDNIFRAGDVKPLVGDGGTASGSGSNISTDSESKKATEVSNISISTSSTSPPGESIPVSDVTDVRHQPSREDVEVIKTVEVDTQPAKENAPEKVSERELDMPELEIVEVPSAELNISEIAAAEALKERSEKVDQPVWDEEPPVINVKPPVTEVVEEEDALEVPLNDPVQEVVAHVDTEKTDAKEEKVVEFPSPIACRSPKLVQSPPAASARDVRSRILKDLQTQLNELEAKRRNKYTQVLSRRMSMKNNNVGKKRDVELS